VYGPHIFHNNDIDTWNYINKFTSFNHFTERVKVNYNGAIYSFPINLMTMHQLWGITTPEEARRMLPQERIGSPDNFEDYCVSTMGWELYDKLIKGYTEKQWQRKARDLPASIIKRIPVRFTYDDSYYGDEYEGIPIGGYTNIFNRLLEGLDVRLNTDFFDDRTHVENTAKKILYTGRIDEYFGYKYGELEYLTNRFESKLLPVEDFQGNSIINYSSPEIPFTRIIEHKHFEFGHQPQTLVTWCYPEGVNSDLPPLWPINTEKNDYILSKYERLAAQEPTLFGGRLAEYKYYDMKDIIVKARKLASMEINKS
jgi:UDP-galactopyranose mutase